MTVRRSYGFTLWILDRISRRMNRDHGECPFDLVLAAAVTYLDIARYELRKWQTTVNQ